MVVPDTDPALGSVHPSSNVDAVLTADGARATNTRSDAVVPAPGHVVSWITQDIDGVRGRWAEAMGGDPLPTVPTLLLDRVVAEFAEVTPPGRRLQEAAAGFGVLRAQQRASSATLLDDVLALRPALWGRLLTVPDLQGDSAGLLLVADRLGEVLDAVLRAATHAYVEEVNVTLVRQATIDHLTGLPNRAFFDERLRVEIEGAKRTGVAPSLVVIDLDRFKGVNDTLGHRFGDEVLSAIAGSLARSARVGDVAARIGGDEFAVILPSTGKKSAARAARRIVRAVDHCARELGVDVGASAGVAWHAEPADAAALFEAADAALYRAKSDAKSSVAVADSSGGD